MGHDASAGCTSHTQKQLYIHGGESATLREPPVVPGRLEGLDEAMTRRERENVLC